ncbi:unnamed protein product [Chilo suppressalis]|uniref:Gustatory receptor n=1 Tax=Chilo suppressalis TaxID=168631 RepID=A0ABN8ART9_CHISP|nr:hypothetical protein evm_005835 [Chilo suppressalis]CAH0398436.1 unnamed protein product [Chilo suppressalis]
MVIALLMKIEEQLKMMYASSRNISECFTKSSTIVPISDICVMEMAFIKACEVKQSINKAFQAPILATAMQCFHSMVSEAYIIVHGAIENRTLNTHEVVNCSVWIMYQILKIYVLAYSGNLLKQKVFRIGQTLHNIPIQKKDMITFLEVQHFSTLMTYHATELTVYGYFPLDATLIFNMIASAAMYLVIMVQFEKR